MAETGVARRRTRHDARAPARPASLVYLLAASHSGSTLLALLLATHPDIGTVGELKLGALGEVDRYRCSCGERIRRCGFWTAIAGDMRHRGLPFDIADPGTDLPRDAGRLVGRLLRPLHRGPVLEHLRDAALGLSPAWRQGLRRFHAVTAGLVECIGGRTGTRWVVDSSKVGLRLKYVLGNPRLDVRVVRLIRDGRAVALTYTDPARFADARDRRLRGGGMGGDRGTERLTMREAAREWRRSNEEAEAILRRLDPGRWTEIRYEALCLDPDAALRPVFALLGVDPDAPRARFRVGAHHVVGNGMRLDGASAVALDDRWRRVLTPGDLAVFDAEAGRLNRRLGYR